MNDIIVGYPDFAVKVHRRFRACFDCAELIAPVVSDILKVSVNDKRLLILKGLVVAAANSYGALLTLALNGYGPDAFKLARGIYESAVNICWLKEHPEEFEDFVDYNIIQWKQLYDGMSQEQRDALSQEHVDTMLADYERVLPRFASSRDKSRPRNEWCRESFWKRAKTAEALWEEQWRANGLEGSGVSLYDSFYRHASSVHHMDIGGVIASFDEELTSIIAPSWEYIEDALLTATGSVIWCISMYCELANLDMADRISRGPASAFVMACNQQSA